MTALKEKIEQLDLECVKYQLVTRNGWSLAKADHVEKLYKAFLHVSETRTEFMAVPSRDIDEFWHNHILDTQKYIEDCERIFGHFVHHFPYVGIFEDDGSGWVDDFGKTREAPLSEFGLDPSMEWEEPLETARAA